MTTNEASLGENGLEDFHNSAPEFNHPLEHELFEYFESWIDPATQGNEGRLQPFDTEHHLMHMYNMYLSGAISNGREGSQQFQRIHSTVGAAISDLSQIDDKLLAWFVNTLYIEKKENGMTKQQIVNVIEKTFIGSLEQELRQALRDEAVNFYEE